MKEQFYFPVSSATETDREALDRRQYLVRLLRLETV